MDQDTIAHLVRLAPPQIPGGFDPVCPTGHPVRGEAGLLARNRLTGVYALFTVGGTMRTVPARWAAGVAAGYAAGLRDAVAKAGAKGGAVKSDAKAAAAKANGAKGGRPRKPEGQ